MKTTFSKILHFLAVSLLTLSSARAADAPAASAPATPPARLTALFIYNRAGLDLNGKDAVLQDFLASKLNTAGFSIVTRDTALTALKTLTANGPATPADKLFDSQSSALRLAQNLNAQYLLEASLDTYTVAQRAFDGYGVKVNVNTATLRVSYRLCDATHGGAITGDTVTVEKKLADTANLKVIDPDVLNALLADAADKLAASFNTAVTTTAIPVAAAAPQKVEFSVSCSMADIMIPDVERTPAGDYVVSPSLYAVAPLDVTVELNGAAAGSAPGNFTGPSGLSKLRLSREGFKTQEMTVNLSQGFALKVAMQMDDAGLARWKDTIEFLQGLKASAKLTDAEVEKVKGIAQMYRQSGIRIDKEIKVNATALPNVQQVNQSLFATPPLPTK